MIQAFRQSGGKQKQLNLMLMAGLFFLVGMGLNLLLAASNLVESETDPWFYFKRQFIFVGIGICVFIITVRIHWQTWLKFAWPIYALSILLLVAVFIPGIGKTAGGATRWIALGPLSMQPSDPAKIALILVLTRLYSKEAEMNWAHIFITVAVIAMPVALIGAEPDFSTALHLSLSAGLFLFLTGFPISVMLLGLFAALPIVYRSILKVPYRRKRILSFLDPWGNRYEGAWQLVASLKSFKAGGISGQGLGEGIRRHSLQARHTDFILSVAAEDMGFLGVGMFILLYFAISLYAFYLLSKIEEAAPRLLGMGFVILFLLQACIHMGVTMGLLPTTGISLPLISYGGSSVVTTCFMFGVVLNVLKENG